MQFEHTIKTIETLFSSTKASFAVISGESTESEINRLDSNRLYNLGSLGNNIGTTTLILQLLERGQLALNTRVQTILPTFKDRRVTVLHLLTHTANLLLPANRNVNWDNRLNDEVLAQLNAGSNLGKAVCYSEIDNGCLNRILEKIYGQPIQYLVQKKILIPLGMLDYKFLPAKKLAHKSLREDLYASLKDITNFAHFQLGQLGQIPIEKSPISQASIMNLYHDWTPNKLQQSLGWGLRFDPLDHHPLIYGTGELGTFLLLDWQHKTGLVLLSNLDSSCLYTREKQENIVNQFLTDNRLC